ncbi:MAG: methionine ABC transporter ATP-binding protein [Clostridium sp.]|uniref:methionine ABC transporter ATP-binding protein n=1 Tax=Clostridium sp. TaxID=1506 RepID=UPI00302FF51F
MIEVSRIKKNFGDLQVLKDVSFTIEEGQVYGIIGHSGAGKSTLLRCMNGLEDYSEGSLKVLGKEVSAMTENELREFRKGVGMIFQNFNLLKRSNVYENVSLPLQLWGFDKLHIDKKVNELLKLVGIFHKKDSMPKELSGGEKQRVAIARALALEPRILLCDEATSALDPKITRDILALLSKINKEMKITIVMVTHQMEVVKEICEKVVLVEDGEIKAEGYVEELFLRPGYSLRKFLGEEEEIVFQDGVNVKIYFPASQSENSVITNMARGLDVNFSIVWGKLEKFRENILGSLVIRIDDESKDNVLEYLDKNEFQWEVL